MMTWCLCVNSADYLFPTQQAKLFVIMAHQLPLLIKLQSVSPFFCEKCQLVSVFAMTALSGVHKELFRTNLPYETNVDQP